MVDALLFPNPQPEPYDPGQEGTPRRDLFTLKIDLTSAEGISQSTLEKKVKATVCQIGATLLDETLDQ